MTSSPIILSVSEITNAIKNQLEPMFRHVWVRGEITNYRLQSSGHHYFSLIEGGSQLGAVLFRGSAASLSSPIKNGDTVIAEGEISVYPPRGNYQLVVRKLSQVGLGEALLKLKALKEKLQALGWFRAERKKQLPTEIRTIGVVTSPTGAVLHDIINILSRRLGTFHLLVNPVRVQGEGAATQIARAIGEFNTYALADVIIVCRGGGSTEDLAAFNEEMVAAACVQSTIPIISAIGHETDLSLTDLVADLRAPTPSAAAELVSHERTERLHRLTVFSNSVQHLISSRLRTTASTIATFLRRCEQSSPQRKIEYGAQRLDELTASISEAMQRAIATKNLLLNQTARTVRQQAPTTKLTEQRTRLVHLEQTFVEKLPLSLFLRKNSLHQACRLIDERISRRLASAQQRYRSRDLRKELLATANRRIADFQQQLSAAASTLQALSPQRTLERGYAIVFRGNTKEVIRSVSHIQPQEPLSIMVADGTIAATVQPSVTKESS